MRSSHIGCHLWWCHRNKHCWHRYFGCMVVFILFNFNSRFSQSPQIIWDDSSWGQVRSNILNGPVGVFAAAIHFWFSLCWVFWFYFAFICVFETKESVIIWIVDINEFFESKDCSFITLTDCILACSLWIFANNFVISCYFELKQGQYHIIWFIWLICILWDVILIFLIFWAFHLYSDHINH